MVGGLSLPLARWLWVAMICTAAGHQCTDGSRTTCMSVRSPATDGAAAAGTQGEGYDAQGVARCSPAGEVVYCLVNHSYHQCHEGELPCCADGSGPSHRGSLPASHHGGATCLPASHPGRAPSSGRNQESFMGELMLQASLGSGQGGAEVLAQLQGYEDVLKATLKTYLGYERVCVKDISVSGRRLLGSDSGNAFTIKFVARRAVGYPAAGELQDMLQDALDTAGADLLIEHASVAWAEGSEEGSEDDSEDDGEGSDSRLIVLGGVLGACVLLGLGVAAVCWAERARGKKRAQVLEGPKLDLEVAVEEGSNNKAAAAAGKVAEADWEASSVSTNEPPASVKSAPSEASIPGGLADNSAAAEGERGTPI